MIEAKNYNQEKISKKIIMNQTKFNNKFIYPILT